PSRRGGTVSPARPTPTRSASATGRPAAPARSSRRPPTPIRSTVATGRPGRTAAAAATGPTPRQAAPAARPSPERKPTRPTPPRPSAGPQEPRVAPLPSDWDFKANPRGPSRDWRVGDPVNMPDDAGEHKGWDTMRTRAWRTWASHELDARAVGRRPVPDQ